MKKPVAMIVDEFEEKLLEHALFGFNTHQPDARHQLNYHVGMLRVVCANARMLVEICEMLEKADGQPFGRKMMDNDSINDWLSDEDFWKDWGPVILFAAIIFVVGFLTGRFFS